MQFAPPYHLPKFPVPEDAVLGEYLRHLCDEGMVWRYGEDADKPEYVERLEYELGIIHEMGFDDYFLIVWDLCEAAKERDIWWNVRGSGAGSVVAYTLGITNVDPFRNRLMFERFLNPGRVNMPDIDLDYPDDRREELIAYTEGALRRRSRLGHHHLRNAGRPGRHPRRGARPRHPPGRGRPRRAHGAERARQAGLDPAGAGARCRI